MNPFNLARVEKEEKLKEVEVFNFGEGKGELLFNLYSAGSPASIKVHKNFTQEVNLENRSSSG